MAPKVAGSSPVGHPSHEAAVGKRSGSSDAYSPYRVEGAFSKVRVSFRNNAQGMHRPAVGGTMLAIVKATDKGAP